MTQTSGFSLSSGQVASTDQEFVRRQLEEIQRALEEEKRGKGGMVAEQERELEQCRKELEEKKEAEGKLRQKARELQEELD